MTGIIDNLSVTSGRGGTVLRIQGRDNGGLLTGAMVDPRLTVTSSTRLVALIGDLISDFGMEVVTDPVLSRQELTGMSQSESVSGLGRARHRAQVRRATLAARGTGSLLAPNGWSPEVVARIPISDARPHMRETVWEFIDRHCRRFGVMCWVDARGRLVIGAPDYDQEPIMRLVRTLAPTAEEPNNILEGGFVEKWEGLASEVTVYGRSHGQDGSRSRFVGHTTNPNVDIHRPMVLHDPSCRSTEEAQRRAEEEIGRQREDAFSLEYDVPHHGQGSRLYAIDTIVDVLDEDIAIEGLYYVAGRTFTCSRQEGAKTRLRLVPLGAISV
jgi:prophage tail gpP-like protein